jgi:hypothetical protein
MQNDAIADADANADANANAITNANQCEQSANNASDKSTHLFDLRMESFIVPPHAVAVVCPKTDDIVQVQQLADVGLTGSHHP